MSATQQTSKTQHVILLIPLLHVAHLEDFISHILLEVELFFSPLRPITHILSPGRNSVLTSLSWFVPTASFRFRRGRMCAGPPPTGTTHPISSRRHAAEHRLRGVRGATPTALRGDYATRHILHVQRAYVAPTQKNLIANDLQGPHDL